jgi:signal transduction histidine kinase
VEISVTDTGPGIPEADRARVVERFVRLENSRNQPGAGLGLSLVAAVARVHQGRLELHEGPGAIDGFGPGLRAALVFPAATGVRP